jgi:hypothetical protein
MKEIKGVVQLHGEHIEVGQANNENYAKIDGVSAYDFASVITNQTTSWKLDKIKDICSELELKDIKTLSGMIDGLYCKEDVEKSWDAAQMHLNAECRIKSGNSMFSTPIHEDKEKYFKDKL